MEWIENILGMSSRTITNFMVISFLITVILIIVSLQFSGKLSPVHSLLGSIAVLLIAFAWFTGIIPCWLSDYECNITPNAINYESEEEYNQWLNECITQMEKDEGKFAGAFCSGGNEGFADFNYYAKKESRRHK